MTMEAVTEPRPKQRQSEAAASATGTAPFGEAVSGGCLYPPDAGLPFGDDPPSEREYSPVYRDRLARQSSHRP